MGLLGAVANSPSGDNVLGVPPTICLPLPPRVVAPGFPSCASDPFQATAP